MATQQPPGKSIATHTEQIGANLEGCGIEIEMADIMKFVGEENFACGDEIEVISPSDSDDFSDRSLGEEGVETIEIIEEYLVTEQEECPVDETLSGARTLNDRLFGDLPSPSTVKDFDDEENERISSGENDVSSNPVGVENRCFGCCDFRKRKSTPSSDFGKKKKTVVPHTVIESPPTQRGGLCYCCWGRSPNYQRTAKYTWWNFLPLNLFRQLSKVSNVYFIFIMCVSLIPTVSPIFPVTSITPVVFIMGVHVIKDLMEDLARYCADRKENGASVRVWDDVGMRWNSQEKKSSIRVGDVVLVKGGEEVPADLVLLESTGRDGIAFVTTSNLDGESNLKKRVSVLGTRKIPTSEGEEAEGESVWSRGVSLKVATENDKRLDQFSGTLLRVGEDTSVACPLSRSNLLLRGVTLRNTREVVGVAVYVGQNTKVARNLRQPRSKSGYLHWFMNIQLVVVLIVQQSMILACIVASAVWRWQVGLKSFYLSRIPASLNEKTPDWLLPLTSWITFLILFEVLIPMSLFVTFEIVKIGQTWCMQARVKAFDDDEGIEKHMIVKSSDLNYDLAFIDIIFSDKTGTLTENSLRFVEWFSKGKYFTLEEEQDSLWAEIPDEDDDVFLFLLSAALNSDVAPVDEATSSEDELYEGASRDEVALVGGFAHRYGMVLKERRKSHVVVTIRGVDRVFETLGYINFTSARKRMSVIVREQFEGAPIWMFCKGADTELIGRSVLSEEEESFAEAVLKFSLDGLRTLLFGVKNLSEMEFNDFETRWRKASLSEDRIEEEEIIANEIENGFRLVGVSAIEDELQEDVPETVEFLLKAGVSFWVLTGDKVETAVNICTTARCIDSDPLKQEKLFLTGSVYGCKRSLLSSRIERILEYLDSRDEFSPGIALILDFLSLDDLFSAEFRVTFVQIIRQCETVLCCRVTPEQKARVVELVEGSLKLRGLSIGDGANDVSMINAAKIGVGIMGKEGTQAARAADFAIPKFKLLRELLAVEGRYCYLRTASMVLISFYKNLHWVIPNFIWCWLSGISGHLIFDSWVYQVYNLLLHVGPPFVFGFFERDLDEECLRDRPLLYKALKQNPFFGVKRLLYWYGLALLQSVVVFFVLYGVVSDNTLLGQSHADNGHALFGHALLSSLLLVAYFSYAMDVKSWNIFMPIALFAGFIFFEGWSLVDSSFPNFVGIATFYKIALVVLDKANFYVYILFAVVVGSAPAFLFTFVRQWAFPSDWETILRSKQKNRVFSIVEETKMDIELKDLS